MRLRSTAIWFASTLSLLSLLPCVSLAQSTVERHLQSLRLRKTSDVAAVVRLVERLSENARLRHGERSLEYADALIDQGSVFLHMGWIEGADWAFGTSLAIRQLLLDGSRHPRMGPALSGLARVRIRQGRDDEAARFETMFHQVQAEEHLQSGRYTAAQSLFKSILDAQIRRLGKDDVNLASHHNDVARSQAASGDDREAETHYRRAIELDSRLNPSDDHGRLASWLDNLGTTLVRLNKYVEAEAIQRRSLDIRRVKRPVDHDALATGFANLAVTLQVRGNYAEAEALHRQSIELRELYLGSEHPTVATGLEATAWLVGFLGRHDDAERLLARSRQIRVRRFGEGHPVVINTDHALAVLRQAQGRDPEAEALHLRSIAAAKAAAGQTHPSLIPYLLTLGNLYDKSGRDSDAAATYREAYAIAIRTMEPEHLDALWLFGSYLVNAPVAEVSGMYDEFFARALAHAESVLGPEHPDLARGLVKAGRYFARSNRWSEALKLFDKASRVVVRHTEREATDRIDTPSTSKFFGIDDRELPFMRAVSAAQHVQAAGRNTATFDISFVNAQWSSMTAAAAAIRKMAARAAAAEPRLQGLLRERSSAFQEWTHLDRRLLSARTTASEVALVSKLRSDQAALDRRIQEIDVRISAEFPGISATIVPRAISAEEARSILSDDEALVLLSSDMSDVYIWVLSKERSNWKRISLSVQQVGKLVKRLRCGLDASAWGDATCSLATGAEYTRIDRDSGRPLPFDHAAAYQLYAALFGDVQEVINGKHLLVIPSGTLTQFPFHALVTAPSTVSHRSARWLAKEHAITILPSVASIAALRRIARPSRATKPYIGFGNPLLDGPDDRYASLAQTARDRKNCATTIRDRVARLFRFREAAHIRTSGALASVAQIRAQSPLPETADELCAVARDLKADPSDVILGTLATEQTVKSLSYQGRLAEYRVIHFATHGTLAGQLSGTNEPGLILTPPDTASSMDDGYLSASEVAGLRLDADWVLLSACNTAAPAAASAEAMSGLATAFFNAQARALLVSHWEVDSAATVKLISSTVAAYARIGRSEALRRAMVEMIERGLPHEAHPSYWAPFVVVGEGARM